MLLIVFKWTYICPVKKEYSSYIVQKEDCISLPKANQTKLKSIKILQIVAFMFMYAQYLFVVLRKYMFAFTLLLGIPLNYFTFTVMKFISIISSVKPNSKQLKHKSDYQNRNRP